MYFPISTKTERSHRACHKNPMIFQKILNYDFFVIVCKTFSTKRNVFVYVYFCIFCVFRWPFAWQALNMMAVTFQECVANRTTSPKPGSPCSLAINSLEFIYVSQALRVNFSHNQVHKIL